jgi:hypothetical protein
MLADYSIGVPLANFCESYFGPIPLTDNDSRITRERKSIMTRGVSIFLAVILMSGAALAQTYPHENTPEDRACRGDARRLCKNDIPDEFKVGSCLQMNKERLSRNCRAMLENRGM